MKTIESDNETSFNACCNGINTQETTDLLTENTKQESITPSNFKLIKSCSLIQTTVGHKSPQYEKISLQTEQDLRSQSMPHSLDNKINGSIDVLDNCDIKTKLLTEQPEHDSPPKSPFQETWFKTWPERCDKLKSDVGNCDKPVDISKVNSKVTFNQALQNISLAYSPVTKQLHLLPQEENNVLDVKDESKKSGHRRTEAGSFSSTVSSLTDHSPSGSLLENEDRVSMLSVDVDNQCTSKKGISGFFNRNVFAWKSNHSLSGWKIFHSLENDTCSNSPKHNGVPGVIASSSALIQHIRPSNLPAKTTEEDQRHRKEYKAIVAAAKKKEAQNSAAKQKQHKLQLQQEEQQAASTKHFCSVVLPNWEAMHNTRKTKDLWWQGLPSSVRGKIWVMAIGNELNLTQQLYEICLQRAQNRLNSPEPSYECDFDQESSMDVIQLDISRTFPNLCIFQEGGPYSDVLHSLLAAYVCYRPDIGYVQGMSFIGAILILNMDEVDAFLCFANLLNRPLHLAAFTLNQTQMQAYYNAYNTIFCHNLMKLYIHFQKSGLTPDLYLLDWIYTVFAKAMPLDVACRVWDVFLRDGDEFLFRTALGILHLHQDVLMEMDFLHGAQFLTRLPDDLSADQLFKSIQTVCTSMGKQTFSQIVDLCKIYE